MSFTEIKPFVTEQEKEYFLSRLYEPDWYQHKSTVSGRLSPLQFKRIEYRGVEAALMKMDPYEVQGWHTDGVELKRSTVILHPLTDNYAPFSSMSGSSTTPIIANTQSKHAVFNNDKHRMNLQLAFDVDYNVGILDNSPIWKLLNRFYKENNE